MNKIEALIEQYCSEGVDFKELGELGEFYGGLTGKNKNDFREGNAQFISYMNVFSNIEVNTEIDTFVRVDENELQNKVEYGDVLFTGSSETPDECGMSSVLTKKINEPLYLNSFCFGYRLTDKSMFLPGFLKYLFRDENIRKQIGQTASGVTRFNVSKKRFARVQIPIPPLPVQEEIVNILDKFTSLEAELEAELEARKTQYEFYRNQLLNFEGKDVEWKNLGEIGRVCMCKRVMKNETAAIGEIPFYKIGTFGGHPDAYISRTLYENYRTNFSFPKKGDILISASGTIGRTVIYDGTPAYFQDSNIVWIDNNERVVSNKFLFHFYKIVKWKTDGGTISRLYNDNLSKTKIPIPPLPEQERIVAILDKFDALVNDISEGLPAEIRARRKQYEYYRNKLLTFKPLAN